jgi:hypothetical protein
MPPKLHVIERLESKTVIDPVTGCWLWQGATDRKGYGQIRDWHDGEWKTRRTHQVSYELFKGPIPLGKMILHGCDTPGCWNPEHLELGDGYQNMRDMMERQRGRGQFTSLKDLGIEPTPVDDSCPF